MSEQQLTGVASGPGSRPSDGAGQAVSTAEAASIPNAECPLVLIEWEDSVQPSGSWMALEDWKPCAAVRIASVGWLISDSADVKALAPNMGGIDELTTVQVSGVIHIPSRCVLSVKQLNE